RLAYSVMRAPVSASQYLRLPDLSTEGGPDSLTSEPSAPVLTQVFPPSGDLNVEPSKFLTDLSAPLSYSNSRLSPLARVTTLGLPSSMRSTCDPPAPVRLRTRSSGTLSFIPWPAVSSTRLRSCSRLSTRSRSVVSLSTFTPTSAPPSLFCDGESTFCSC